MGIWYILTAQWGSHIPTSETKCIYIYIYICRYIYINIHSSYMDLWVGTLQDFPGICSSCGLFSINSGAQNTPPMCDKPSYVTDPYVLEIPKTRVFSYPAKTNYASSSRSPGKRINLSISKCIHAGAYTGISRYVTSHTHMYMCMYARVCVCVRLRTCMHACGAM